MPQNVFNSSSKLLYHPHMYTFLTAFFAWIPYITFAFEASMFYNLVVVVLLLSTVPKTVQISANIVVFYSGNLIRIGTSCFEIIICKWKQHLIFWYGIIFKLFTFCNMVQPSRRIRPFYRMDSKFSMTFFIDRHSYFILRALGLPYSILKRHVPAKRNETTWILTLFSVLDEFNLPTV